MGRESRARRDEGLRRGRPVLIAFGVELLRQGRTFPAGGLELNERPEEVVVELPEPLRAAVEALAAERGATCDETAGRAFWLGYTFRDEISGGAEMAALCARWPCL